MPMRRNFGRLSMIGTALAALGFAGVATLEAAPDEVTFTKDIAPILQRSCQNCHQPETVATK